MFDFDPKFKMCFCNFHFFFFIEMNSGDDKNASPCSALLASSCVSFSHLEEEETRQGCMGFACPAQSSCHTPSPCMCVCIYIYIYIYILLSIIIISKHA
jgi:hypothetical protein